MAGRGRVRFLHAAYGYRPFRIAVSNRRLVNGLRYGGISGYSQVGVQPRGVQRLNVHPGRHGPLVGGREQELVLSGTDFFIGRGLLEAHIRINHPSVPFQVKISRKPRPSLAIALAPYWLMPTPWP